MKKCFVMVLLCCLLAAGTAFAKTGTLLVAFGTSMDSARPAIDDIEKAYKKAAGNDPVLLAFTSDIIRNKLAKEGMELPHVAITGGFATEDQVYKALALGADAVLIARPFVTAVYGAGADGVAAYTAQLGNELADTMRLCGAPTLDAITRDMVRVIK